MYLISIVWHLATPFLVFSSFLELTLTGHVTQKYGFLSKRKIKFTNILEVAKFGWVLVNSRKVMIIIRFYANQAQAMP